MQLKLLKKYLIKGVAIDDMQFSSMPGKGTIHAVFILRGYKKNINKKT